MTFWNKISPLCTSSPYNGSFKTLIESQKYGYFSKKEYGVSGYFDPKFILIVQNLLKNKHLYTKKIFKAVLIQINGTEFSVEIKVFKRAQYLNKNSDEIKTIYKVQQELSQEYPDAVAEAPVILGTKVKEKVVKEKKCLFIRFDTMEARYPTTFSRDHVIKGKISLKDAVQGLFKMALALNHLHSKGRIHGDVKNWNVFVVGAKLKLFDFDLSRSYPHLTLMQFSYDFWDHSSNKQGFLSPFCDVFGWTALLSTIFWGKKFNLILRHHRESKDQFMKALNDLYLDHAPKKNISFFETCYPFIKEVFEADYALFEVVEPLSLSTPLTMERAEMAQFLHSRTQGLYPSMQKCVELVRPWIEKLK